MTKLTAFFPIVRTTKKSNHRPLVADDTLRMAQNNNKRLSSSSLTSSPSSSSENKRGKVDAVDALLASLTSKTWRCALDTHFQTSKFGKLAEFVETERRSKTVYPPADHVWTALNSCEIDDIKVVIVGQDPYHGPKQAHGLSFSVFRGQPPPPSLKNVYKELSQDADVDFQMPDHGYLIRWAQQGVLLLNAVMTVRQGEANSHKSKGWEDVTDEIIKAVDRKARENGKGVVFLLWGNPAMKKALQLIDGTSGSIHKVICTSHPSPLGATKTATPFLGSKCFSKCNAALAEMGRETIDWKVDASS
jgi:uracil-DNA glycosylase